MIGLPQELYAQTSAPGATLVLNLAIPAGVTAFIFGADVATLSKYITGVADDAGNTWTVDDVETGSSGTASIVRCKVTHALTVSNNITITFADSSPGTVEIWVETVSGLVGTAIDKLQTSTGTSTSPLSLSTGTLSTPKQIVWGLFVYNGTSTWTKGASYSNPTTPQLNSRASLEYKIVSSNAAVTADGTLGTSRTWRVIVATYAGL